MGTYLKDLSSILQASSDKLIYNIPKNSITYQIYFYFQGPYGFVFIRATFTIAIAFLS